MKSLAFILGLVVAVHSVLTPKENEILHPRSATDWSLTFLDTFNGNPGTLPSSNNWIFDYGNSYPDGAAQWGNNEYESYTSDTSNIQITSHSTLLITPRLSGSKWTSARIETQRSDFQAKAGGRLYVEASIKLGNAPASKQQGIWPAFWALGSEFRGNYTNWPAVTEWDFMEVINGQPTMYSTIHCGYAPGGPCNEYNGLGSGGVPFALGQWHTIGFEVDRSMCGDDGEGSWEDESLNWYLDRELKFSVTGRTVADEQAWNMLAHQEHFLLLNIAVGGNWPGPPNNQTIDGPSVGMEVDYVGVWNSIW